MEKVIVFRQGNIRYVYELGGRIWYIEQNIERMENETEDRRGNLKTKN